jgi:hypothetical protein
LLNLKRLQPGTALLNWNSELPSSGTGDPLGMTLRVGARLGSELLHCITSITPRARYYSFFPWAFQRAQDRAGDRADFDRIMRLVLIDERAMTLGAVLHHDGSPCEGGALQGSNRAVDLAANTTKHSIELSRWSHLRDNTSGFTADAEVELDVRSFGDLTYYGTIFDDEDDAASVELPPALSDVSERWRIFQFHNYLTTALEALLAGVVRAILGQPAGRKVAEIIETFNSIEAQEALGELLKVELSVPLMDLTPAGSLALLAINVPSEAGDIANSAEIFASNQFVERFLCDSLIERGLVSGPAGPAVAALLLYSLILRYDLTVSDAHKGWNTLKVFDPGADVAMPTVAHMLNVEFEDWWNTPNREILSRIVGRFVVRQHETMSYEKGFGGSPPLFRVDGTLVVGTGITRDDVDPGNPRFPSAIQVLRDLRLIDRNQEKGQGARFSNTGTHLLARRKREHVPCRPCWWE